MQIYGIRNPKRYIINNDMLKEKLRTRRKLLKLTQAVVAERVGISRQYYNKLEKGHHNPSNIVLTKIASTLKVMVGYFWLETGS